MQLTFDGNTVSSAINAPGVTTTERVTVVINNTFTEIPFTQNGNTSASTRGAIIGGSVGGVLAIAAIVSGAILLFIRIKKNMRENNRKTRPDEGPHIHGVLVELPSTNNLELEGKLHLQADGREILEAPSCQEIPELDAIVEMSGSEVVEQATTWS